MRRLNMELYPLENEPLLVTDVLRPRSPDEAAKRALFFAQAMLQRAGRGMSNIAEKGSLPNMSVVAIGRRISGALKRLAVVTAYMAFLDQKASNQEDWLKDYQILMFQHLDEQIAQPSAKSIIERDGGLEEESLITKTALELSTELGISQDGTLFLLQSMMISLKDYAATTMIMSLRDPLDLLGDLLSTIVNGSRNEDDDDEEEPGIEARGRKDDEENEGFLTFD